MISTEEVQKYLQGAELSNTPSFESWRKAGEAAADNAHVAVYIYYRTAIEAADSNVTKAALLYLAVDYAKKLKKHQDREAVAKWSENVLHPMHSERDSIDKLFGTQPIEMNLVGAVRQELASLRAVGK